MTESERVIDLYERNAFLWDKDRGRSLFEKPWLDRFRARLPPSASILDLGCGSGEPIARYFIENGHEVTELDASRTLVELCRERFPTHHWILGDMRQLDLNRKFGGILAWDSFFHLPADDQRRMFSVFRRHAAATAVLMFTSGPSQGEAIGTYRSEPLFHASLDGAEYRSLLQEQNFDLVSHVIEDPTCGHHTIWLAKLRSGSDARR